MHMGHAAAVVAAHLSVQRACGSTVDMTLAPDADVPTATR